MGLDELASHPKIWKISARARRWETIPTGFAELDCRLPGAGWPQKAITEVFVERYGIGELSLFLPALARAEQKKIVWIAPPYIPYAPALARAGIDLSRMLLVQPARDRDVPWAVEQVLRSRQRLAVLAWLREADPVVLRRLQLNVETRRAWAIFYRPIALLHQKSPAALKLSLARAAGALRVEIVRCRGGRPGVVDLPEREGGG